MTDREWEDINNEQFDCLHDLIDDLKAELRKYPGRDTFKYMQPLRMMAIGALVQLYQEKNKRIEESENILKNI